MFVRYSLSDGQEHLVAKSIERKIYRLQDQPTVFDAVRSLGINAIKRWIEWPLCLASAYFLSGEWQAAQRANPATTIPQTHHIRFRQTNAAIERFAVARVCGTSLVSRPSWKITNFWRCDALAAARG